jgi:hypothetical protein
VQRGVEGGAAGGVPAQRAERLLERKGIVAEPRGGLGQEGARGLRALAAVVHGGGLAASCQAVVLELDLHHRLGGARAARDPEFLGKGKRDRARPQLHGAGG